MLSRTLSVFAPGNGKRYTAQNLSFVADSAVTTLTFRDASVYTQDADLLLDHVQITAQSASVLGSSNLLPNAANRTRISSSGPALLSCRVARTDAGGLLYLSSGEPALLCEVQRSFDLSHWASLATIRLSPEGSAIYADTTAAWEDIAFYRVLAAVPEQGL